MCKTLYSEPVQSSHLQDKTNWLLSIHRGSLIPRHAQTVDTTGSSRNEADVEAACLHRTLNINLKVMNINSGYVTIGRAQILSCALLDAASMFIMALSE